LKGREELRGEEAYVFTALSPYLSLQLTREGEPITLNHEIEIVVTDGALHQKVTNEPADDDDSLFPSISDTQRRINNDAQRN
jgi:hypothetical protein